MKEVLTFSFLKTSRTFRELWFSQSEIRIHFQTFHTQMLIFATSNCIFFFKMKHFPNAHKKGKLQYRLIQYSWLKFGALHGAENERKIPTTNKPFTSYFIRFFIRTLKNLLFSVPASVQLVFPFSFLYFLAELRDYCETARDCRDYAYVCNRKMCECAEGYRIDDKNATCVGGKITSIIFNKSRFAKLKGINSS